MKKIDIQASEARSGSRYPVPFNAPGMNKVRYQVGRAAGLTQFGVNYTVIQPGAWSSQRHWHSHDEEFVFVVEGEVVLITDAGEEVLGAGDCAGFKAGEPDGHHLINRSDRPAMVLEIGTDHADDVCTYSDVDMQVDAEGYKHKDGQPYPPSRRA
jgi:uncharacterized cupin superfamily protein